MTRSLSVLTLAIAVALGAFTTISHAHAGGSDYTYNAKEDDTERSDYYDPIEPVNRFIFGFNAQANRYVIHPAIDTYRFVVPDQGRKIAKNFIRNLRSPENIANHLLQGDIDGAGHSLFRFVVNTFAGFGGLLDVAEWEGYEYKYEDFGQTLAVWGVADGPYVVIPLIGPASLRDGLGYAVDGYANPVRAYLDNTERTGTEDKLTIASFIHQKNATMDIEKDLEANSIDPYAATRNALFQLRRAEISNNSFDDFEQPEIEDFGDF